MEWTDMAVLVPNMAVGDIVGWEVVRRLDQATFPSKLIVAGSIHGDRVCKSETTPSQEVVIIISPFSEPVTLRNLVDLVLSCGYRAVLFGMLGPQSGRMTRSI